MILSLCCRVVNWFFDAVHLLLLPLHFLEMFMKSPELYVPSMVLALVTTAWWVKRGIKRRFWQAAVSHMLVWTVPIALTAFSITAVSAAINVLILQIRCTDVLIPQFYDAKYSSFSCFSDFLWGYLHGSFMAFRFWKDQE